MNPRRGENPPLISSSRSQICRAVRSHDGHSRECALQFVGSIRVHEECGKFPAVRRNKMTCQRGQIRGASGFW